MKGPKIGVYAGSGTSHSWLWFVDLFEKAGCYDLVFLDEFCVRNNDINALDVLVISGGDTFAVARGLGKKGGQNIRAFVESGGVYIGSCAGAYLPMNSSKKPLDWFNFVDVKITNLSKTLPFAQIPSSKFLTAYGCDFVFHPVREAVSLKTTPGYHPDRVMAFSAPLYGGPGMKAGDPAWVLAVYEGFTKKTTFLADRQIAEKTLVGNAAVVRVPFKKGCFYLLGPHLEHPRFERANQFILDAINSEPPRVSRTAPATPEKELFFQNKVISTKRTKELVLILRRELSNSRIVASNLEFLPVQWLIGQKVYEPLKIRVYLESMWKRLTVLEKNRALTGDPGLYEPIKTAAQGITIAMRRIKQQIDAGLESLETAIIIFDLLHVLSIGFFNLYFSTRAGQRDPHHEQMGPEIKKVS